MLVERSSLLRQPELQVKRDKGINEVFEDRLLICSPVKNRVVLVNPEIDSGLGFKEGEEYPRSLFVRSAYPNLIQKKEGEELHEGWPGHERSTLYTRKKIKDEQGRWHRDIDFKGNGYVSDGMVELPGGKMGDGFYGLLEIKEAFKEY